MKRFFLQRLINGTVFSTGITVLLFLWLLVTPAAGSQQPQLNDADITDAVEDELYRDRAVASQKIDVVTANGVVTLKGSVDNLLARERAARIAGIVKGVRSVVNRIIVYPAILRIDPQIEMDVHDALLSDPATDSTGIEIEVDDKTVILSGKVNSWREKMLCGKVAKRVAGVKALENNLYVVKPKKRFDREIEAEIEEGLKWDATVDNGLIDVAVINGNVILSGTVGSLAEKRRAFHDAHVAGVESVEISGLQVKKWARDKDLKGDKYTKKSPDEIASAIKAALRNDPRVAPFDVTPQLADDGTTVILRGKVGNFKAKRAAGQDARNTVGVRSVENRIKVRPEARRSDERMEDDIRHAFSRNPYLENKKIFVDVRNGEAGISGTVDDFFEKSEADYLASGVEGVLVVENNIKIRRAHNRPVPSAYIDEYPLYDGSWNDYKPRSSARSDRQIKADIQDAYEWSPFVDPDDVRITVEKGVATLKGTVDSLPEYNAAESNAYKGGAVWVDNELIINQN